mmetsp:Transcript_33722/g.92436  ORF Transcript_33722/g.92436 Transcript_33722/m.92436 type:complete len:200 (-) Transcript_33722:187-786(-)
MGLVRAVRQPSAPADGAPAEADGEEDDDDIDISGLNIPNMPLAPPDILRNDTDEAAGSPAAPNEPLEPVLESTERSAFSATNNWGGPDGPDGPRMSTESTGGPPTSVASGGVDSLETLSHDELLAECRRARAELRTSRDGEAKAKADLEKAMEANKTLQQQLKDLNAVVGAIVTAELGGVPLPKGKASPFPGKAKPGKK